VKATNLREMLSRDEGRVSHAYPDSLGYWTIGVGHLIDKRRGGRLPEHVIDTLLDHDIAASAADLYTAFPWARGLDPARRDVLISMAFQLGIGGLSRFKNAMEAMRVKDWPLAAKHFLDSKVAKEQAPTRWQRFARQIRTGEYQ